MRGRNKHPALVRFMGSWLHETTTRTTTVRRFYHTHIYIYREERIARPPGGKKQSVIVAQHGNTAGCWGCSGLHWNALVLCGLVTGQGRFLHCYLPGYRYLIVCAAWRVSSLTPIRAPTWTDILTGFNPDHIQIPRSTRPTKHGRCVSSQLVRATRRTTERVPEYRSQDSPSLPSPSLLCKYIRLA